MSHSSEPMTLVKAHGTRVVLYVGGREALGDSWSEGIREDSDLVDENV